MTLTRPFSSVEAISVTRLYGTTAALRGVSLRCTAGTATLLEGPNGSGKSTLLGILSTAIRPTSGRVIWAPLGEDREQARPHIGWLSHDALVYPDLSGWDNLRWAARLYGLGLDTLGPFADRIKLGAFANRPVRSMSRGQRQRIALARALLHSPSLLLLDEPTTGLDREGVSLVIRMVREEIDAGAIGVIITHDKALGVDLNARAVQLDRGRIGPLAGA